VHADNDIPAAPDSARLWGLGEVLKLSLPTAAGMVNGTILTFVDGLLVAKYIGPTALSAQFIAGIFSFAPVAMAMGLLSVVNTFVAQSFGAGKLHDCARYTWAGLYLAVLAGLAMLPLLLGGQWFFATLADLIVRLNGQPTAPAELAMQVMYSRYMLAGAVLSLGARVLENFFYGTQRPRVVYVVSFAAVTVNLLVAYVLITGRWGFKPMGLEGAAIGTLVGYAIGFVAPMLLFLTRGNHRAYATRSTFGPSKQLMTDLARIGWPAGVQFFSDVVSWALFISVAVGFFGEVHKSASAAVMRYLQVSFMPAVGVGVACTALVGKYIGQGRPGLSVRRTRAGLLLAVTYMGLCGLAFYLFRYSLIGLFVRVSAETGEAVRPEQIDQIVQIGGRMMVWAAMFQVFDAVGIIFIGALRGAGETLWPMLVTLVLSWAVLIGGGCLMVRYAWQLQSIGPWIAASAYVILLGLVMAWRFESGAWRRIQLVKPFRPAPAGVMPVPPSPEAPDEVLQR
jgi:MATE family multidrug resistance protein